MKTTSLDPASGADGGSFDRRVFEQELRQAADHPAHQQDERAGRHDG